MRYFSAKLFGAFGMLLVWYGCMVKAGYTLTWLPVWPFFGIACWIAGFALLGIESSLSKKLPGFNNIKNVAVSFLYNIGMAIYVLNNIAVIATATFKALATPNVPIISTALTGLSISMIIIGDMLNRGGESKA